MTGTEGRDKDDRARRLVMGALDGELTVEEQEELQRLLDADPTLQAEWNRLVRVKEVTKTMTLPALPDEVWEDYWSSVYSRIERGIGWILTSVGAIVLLGYVAWTVVQELLADVTVPLFVRAALLTVAIGLVVLFVSVVREKLFIRRKDPYKDVKR